MIRKSQKYFLTGHHILYIVSRYRLSLVVHHDIIHMGPVRVAWRLIPRYTGRPGLITVVFNYFPLLLLFRRFGGVFNTTTEQLYMI